MGGKAIREGLGTVAKLLGAGIMERESEREKYRQRIEEIKLNKTLSDDSYELVTDPAKASQSDIVAGGVRYRKKSAMERIREQINAIQTVNAELPPDMSSQYEGGLDTRGRPSVQRKAKSRSIQNKDLTQKQAFDMMSNSIVFDSLDPEAKKKIRSVASGGIETSTTQVEKDPKIISSIAQAKSSGYSDQQISEYLKGKGIDPSAYGL